jgi:hypothetical protein
MEADRTEMHNLGPANPERVKELSAKWDVWAARCQVLPLGGWEKPAPQATAQPEPAKKKKKKKQG